MIRKDDFCKKYNISDKSFKEANIGWTELETIYNDYVKQRPTLDLNLNFLAESLRIAPKVHSIKVRLKDPEHLIEKIIRRKREEPSLKINVNNYRSIINDLVGVRALHLFKNDWLDIHNYIIKSWELKSRVVANVREGDTKALIDLFRGKNCVVKKHPFGYRSVHYIIASKPHKEAVIAEIQVRTIFEEGWSEIDHLIRYPYVHDDPILEQFLSRNAKRII
jgi:putative GTP pyrophosphokinase